MTAGIQFAAIACAWASLIPYEYRSFLHWGANASSALSRKPDPLPPWLGGVSATLPEWLRAKSYSAANVSGGFETNWLLYATTVWFRWNGRAVPPCR